MIDEIKALFEKLERLKRLYPDKEDQEQFDAWQKKLEDLASADSIKDHLIITNLIEKGRKFIEDTQKILLTKTSDELSDKNRDSLITQYRAYEEFLEEFIDIPAQVEGVAKDIENAMEHYEKNYKNY